MLRDQVAMLKARLSALEDAVNAANERAQAPSPLSAEPHDLAEKQPGK